MTEEDVAGGHPVTLLLTDVEGSTRLMERDPDLARALLAEHDSLVAERTARHGGRFVRDRSEGDSAFVVFADAAEAVRCAVALQRDLAARWPDGGVRVRMGLHAGVPHRRGEQLYGPVVNRCGAVRNLGHGGQVLVSSAVADLLGAVEGIDLRDLGEHRLQGLNDRERIRQAVVPDLPADFPPLRSPDEQRHNLGPPRVSYVEPAPLVAEVLDAVDHARLLTLVGPGGIGKTALAEAVARRGLGRFAHGVWLAPLSGRSDDVSVGDAIAAALGLREQPGRPLLDTVVDHVTGRELLLVLDGCEGAAPLVATLVERLVRGARVHVLATARQALGVPGEIVRPVRPLPLPPAAAGIEEASSSPAVRLLLDRLRSRRDDLPDDTVLVPAAAEACRRLDGIPLAIEVAAGRLAGVPADQLPDALRRAVDRRGPRGESDPATEDLDETVAAALAASHADLAAEERTLFRRIGAFHGGFTLEAAEDVCAAAPLGEDDVLDALSGLVDRSLVLVDDVGGGVRYRTLQSVQAYALGQLRTAGEDAEVSDRHRRCFQELVRQTAGFEQRRGPEQLDALEADHDNVLAVVRPADAGPVDDELWWASTLVVFWDVRGHWSFGRQVLEDLLARPSTLHHPRAAACRAAARLASLQGDLEAADLRLADAAEELALLRDALLVERDRAAEDPAAVAAVDARIAVARSEVLELVVTRADLARVRGDLQGAQALGEDGVRRARELGADRVLTRCLELVGTVDYHLGRLDRALERLEEAAERASAAGDEAAAGNLLNTIGAIRWMQGDFLVARELYRESLAIRERLGDRLGVAQCTLNLADVDVVLGRDGRDECARALALSRELGHPGLVASALRLQGEMACAAGDLEAASRSLDEAAHLMASIDDPSGAATVHARRARVARAAAEDLAPWTDAVIDGLRAVEARGDAAVAVLCRAELIELAAAAGEQEQAHRWALRAAAAPSGIDAVDIEVVDACASALARSHVEEADALRAAARRWRAEHGAVVTPGGAPEAPTIDAALALVRRTLAAAGP